MSIKLIDIAHLAGVSKATASRALCGSPLVREDTKERVQAVADAMGYRPNALAQAMATKKSGVIGFLMHKKSRPYIAHTFFGPILDGAMTEAARRGYHIVIAAANDNTHTFDEHFIKDSIDGAMLVSFYPQEAAAEFRRRRIPLVIINDFVPSPANTFLLDDNYGGVWTLMEHLVSERGHRKILFLTDRLTHPSYSLRYRAYVDFHLRHNIPMWGAKPLHTQIEYYVPYLTALRRHQMPDVAHHGSPVIARTNSFEDGERAMEAVIKQGDLPTAVLASADSLALGAMCAIKKAGLRVPEDIAVAGYDDIDAAMMSDPPLTTVWVDRERIGHLAVGALIDRMARPDAPSKTIFVPNRLHVRQST